MSKRVLTLMGIFIFVATLFLIGVVAWRVGGLYNIGGRGLTTSGPIHTSGPIIISDVYGARFYANTSYTATQLFLMPKIPETIDTTAGTTYSGSVVDGWVLRDPNGANRIDQLPKASVISTLYPTSKYVTSLEYSADTIMVHHCFIGYVKNTANAAETISLIGNTGVTVDGTTITIDQGETAVLGFYTQAAIGPMPNFDLEWETITVYHLGILAHP